MRWKFFGRNIRSVVVIPILLPGIVTGVAMLSFFGATGIPLGLGTVIIGHATFGFPIVFNTVNAQLARLPRNLEKASADLGATPGTDISAGDFSIDPVRDYCRGTTGVHTQL